MEITIKVPDVIDSGTGNNLYSVVDEVSSIMPMHAKILASDPSTAVAAFCLENEDSDADNVTVLFIGTQE